MKVTYTAPNRSHHYPYARQIHQRGVLHHFVSGFTRLSPRSPLPELGDKVKRHDFIQTISLLTATLRFPDPVTSFVRRQSDQRLDAASYMSAVDSDVFLFYRTQGIRTTRRLHAERAKTICVMEEVNSHVAAADEILCQEYEQLGLKKPFASQYDFDLRLESYEDADYILTPSEFVKRSFTERGFSEDRLLKVNFGFKTFSSNGEEAPEKDKEDVFRVLYVGQLHFRKGLRYAIEAFKRLKHPRKEFVIVGPKTTLTGLEKVAMPKEVIFTGVLKGDKLAEQYRNASLFVLPSLEEGLALVQGEALSFGIPLLITTNTGGEDIITEGKEGFIVPPADVGALYDKMQLLADNPLLREEMSVHAFETTRSLGSWDAAGEKLVSELKRIAGN